MKSICKPCVASRWKHAMKLATLSVLAAPGARADVTAFAYNFNGEYVGRYVQFTSEGDQLSAALCDEDIKSPREANVETCLAENALSVPMSKFLDKVFFISVKNSLYARDSDFLQGNTMKEVMDYCRSRLPQYAPAAAQMVDENPDLKELFKLEQLVYLTKEAIDADSNLDFISRNSFDNLSGRIVPIQKRYLFEAIEKAVQVP